MQQSVMNEGKPVWHPNGQPWTEMPIPAQFKNNCCFMCMINLGMVQMPKVRGIPEGSQPFSETEKQLLCQRFAGHWFIQPVGFEAGSPNIAVMNSRPVAYTDMEVRGDSIFISGGMHNTTQYARGGADRKGSTISTAVANKAQEQKIIPFHGTDGRLYVDNVGSYLHNETEGELELVNALGAKLLLQRGWKKNGLTPPNPTVDLLPVVTGIVVAQAAPVQDDIKRT